MSSVLHVHCTSSRQLVRQWNYLLVVSKRIPTKYNAKRGHVKDELLDVKVHVIYYGNYYRLVACIMMERPPLHEE